MHPETKKLVIASIVVLAFIILLKIVDTKIQFKDRILESIQYSSIQVVSEKTNQ